MTIHRIFLNILTALCLIMMPVSGHAQDAATDPNVEKVRAMFQRLIDFQTSMNSTQEIGKVEYDGELLVEPAGEYYAVTMPRMTIAYPEGAKLDFGMISANVKPYSKPGQWAMTMALPTPIVFLGQGGKEAVKINIGAQSSAGIFDEEALNFYKIDTQYRDVRIEVQGDQPFEFTIPEINLRSNFDIDDQGLWSGPGYFSMKGMSFEFENGSGQASIGEFRVNVSLDQFNPKSAMEIRDAFKEIAINEDGTPKTELTPEETEAFANTALDALFRYANGIGLEYKVSGIEITRPQILGSGTDHLQLSEAHFGGSLEGLLGDLASIGISFGYQGFSMSPGPEQVPEQVIPTDIDIKLEATSIPIKQLIETARKTLDTPETAANPQMALMAMSMSIPTMLAENGTKVHLHKEVTLPAGRSLVTDGTFNVNAASPLMLIGEGKLTFTGLDEFIAELGNMAANTQDPMAPQYQQMMMGLNMIKAFAKPDTDAEGRIQYVLNVNLTEDGKALINGQDVGAMFGAGMGTPTTIEIQPQAVPETVPEQQAPETAQ